MATKKRIVDPAAVQNAQVLARRKDRIILAEASTSIDLGLDLQEQPPASAADFLRDEWDKKTFGDAPKTTTRIIYGPDPIVNACPEFHERLERYGLEAVAEAFQELILKQGEMAAPDPIMRKGLRASIAKFGKDATAKAFRDRILSIPARTVDVEIDTALDPLLSNPMREAVAKYGTTGMAVKFLSDRVNQVLGMRGYKVVIDERGDPVKIGTLIMAEIPQEWADRRRQHFASESDDAIQEQQEQYFEAASKEIRDAKVTGIAPLGPEDCVSADPALNDLYNGESRKTGLDIQR